MRVVSLLPASTELCYALGRPPVAVSHECDYPPAARDRPAVTDVALADTGDTAAVNDAVDPDTESAGEDASLLSVDRAALRAADPDLVLTQGVCDVCAVDDAAVRDAFDDAGVDASVLVVHPHTVADVLADVVRVGVALGRPERARRLRDRLAERVAAVRRRSPSGPGYRTVVLDWLDPPMVAGHWVPGLVRLAGGRSGLAAPGTASGPVSWERVREYDPQALVVAPCGLSLAETRSQAGRLTDRPGWADLAAVRAGRVLALDGNHLLNRAGPRLVGALELLGDLVAPDRDARHVPGLSGPFP
ncbi:MAG: ABC transporter substrate-binding protein [Halobacteriaceae archaeon]